LEELIERSEARSLGRSGMRRDSGSDLDYRN